jgi:type IV fimbrial biogenesis protein FimT
MLTRPARGFTLIEVLVGLILLGVLAVLAIPSFVTMMQNAKLRSGAEAIATGLQLARNEALRRNKPTEFVLTNLDPTEDNVGAAPNTAGPHWIVRENVAGATAFVQGRSAFEGSGQAAATVVQVAGVIPSSPSAATAGAVTFNALGRAELLADATFDVSNPSGGACKTAGGDEPMRCLRVVVTPGGRVRMCDPAVTDVNDTRKC